MFSSGIHSIPDPVPPPGDTGSEKAWGRGGVRVLEFLGSDGAFDVRSAWE